MKKIYLVLFLISFIFIPKTNAEEIFPDYADPFQVVENQCTNAAYGDDFQIHCWTDDGENLIMRVELISDNFKQYTKIGVYKSTAITPITGEYETNTGVSNGSYVIFDLAGTTPEGNPYFLVKYTKFEAQGSDLRFYKDANYNTNNYAGRPFTFEVNRGTISNPTNFRDAITMESRFYKLEKPLYVDEENTNNEKVTLKMKFKNPSEKDNLNYIEVWKVDPDTKRWNSKPYSYDVNISRPEKIKCVTGTPEEREEKIKKDIEEIKNKISNLETQNENLNTQITRLKEQVSSASGFLATWYQSQLTTAEAKKQENLERIENYNREIIALQTPGNDTCEIKLDSDGTAEIVFDRPDGWERFQYITWPSGETITHSDLRTTKFRPYQGQLLLPPKLPVCDSLSATKTSAEEKLETTLTCAGTNATNFKIDILDKDGNIINSKDDKNFDLILDSVGDFTAVCYVDDTITADSCKVDLKVEQKVVPPTPVCNSISATKTSGVESLNTTLTCAGENNSTYKIEVKDENGNIVKTENNPTLNVDLTNIGKYSAICYADTITSDSCKVDLNVTKKPGGSAPTTECISLYADKKIGQNSLETNLNCSGLNAKSIKIDILDKDLKIVNSFNTKNADLKLDKVGDYKAICYVDETITSSKCKIDLKVEGKEEDKPKEEPKDEPEDPKEDPKEEPKEEKNAVCKNLIATKTSEIKKLNTTLTCSGENNSKYKIEIKDTLGNIITNTDKNILDFTLNTVGEYEATCYVDEITSPSCKIALEVKEVPTITTYVEKLPKTGIGLFERIKNQMIRFLRK